MMNHRFIEIRKQIGKFIANFSVTEENGVEYIFDGDVIREGLEISTYDDKGDIVPLSNGEYTITGVKVIISDGKVLELPEVKSELDSDTAEPMTEDVADSDSKQNTEELTAELSAVKAENETLRAENETLRAELEEIKNKPLADPVPQRTDMSTAAPKEIPSNIKGTKYEKAYRIFNK